MPASDTPLRALLKAAKADPEGCPVHEVEMTVDEARAIVDDSSALEGHPFTEALDTEQGPVFAEEIDEAFIVVRIRRSS